MKTFLLIISLSFLIASCQKDDDDNDPVRAKLEAHTWVFDSSNTATSQPGSDTPVMTISKGDSSRLLTCSEKTFVISDRQGTDRKKYRLENFEIY